MVRGRAADPQGRLSFGIRRLALNRRSAGAPSGGPGSHPGSRREAMQYNFNWDVIWRNFHWLSDGLALGLEMAVVSLVLGSIIGLACALILVSPRRALHRPVRI